MDVSLLREAFLAMKSGDKQGAAQILAKAVTRNPKDELAWFMLSDCVESVERKRYCLNRVLSINPANKAAREALAQIESVEVKPGKNSTPPALPLAAEPRHIPTPVADKPSKRSRARGLFLLVVTLVVVAILGHVVRLLVGPYELFTESVITPTATIDPSVAKARWATVDIRDLAKNPDKYAGAQLHYKGEVFNIQESSSGTVMQIWVAIPGGDRFDRESVVVACRCKASGVYEGTIVEFWGYGAGSAEGTNAFGGKIQQPLISVTSAGYMTYFR